VADSLIKTGIHLEKSGNYINAISKYKQAESLIKKNNLGKSYEALTSSLIGYAYANYSKYTDALRYLKRSAYCFESDSNTMHSDYCMLLHDIAVLSYFNLHQPADSLCLYAKKAVYYAYEVMEEDDPNLGRFLDLAGLCKSESKDLPGAKPFFLYAYQMLIDHQDSLASDLIDVCDHLSKMYNLMGQQDSSIYFAKEKLKLAKNLFDPRDPKLAEVYYSYAFALNVGNFTDASIVYLDTAMAISPEVCKPKEKAAFYYRGGQYHFAKKDLQLARHYFIQSGTYLANNKITDTLEASCWLWVASIYLQDLKIAEAKPYIDKACKYFTKYYGAQDSRTVKVCQMADGLTKIDVSNDLDLKNFFPELSPTTLIPILDKMVDTSVQTKFGNDYLTQLQSESKKNPDYKELPRAMQLIINGKYEDAIKIIQHAYIKIIPGYLDSLNYTSDPNIKSPTLQTNIFVVALLLKAVAYDQLGTAEKDLEKLKYAWRILEKCDTLMSNIRINALNEDIGAWGGILKSLYVQMITTSGKMSKVTQLPECYNKTLFASERLKAFNLLKSRDLNVLKSMAPADLLANEKGLVEKSLQLRRDLARARQFQPVNKKKERSLQDSLFLAEANLATLRSNLKVKYPKYWEANNEKPIASVQDIMQQLDNHTAILSYTCTAGESATILVITGAENSFILDKPITGAQAMVTTMTNYLAGKPVSKADYNNAAYNLYRMLIVDLPPAIDQLIIIPDGFLYNLPFEALLTDNVKENVSWGNYPWLLKRFAISYAYSATLAYDQMKRKTRQEFPEFLLGYSSPKYNDFKPVKPICDAKGLKYEIRDRRETATRTDLLSHNLKNYKIVHITAHGRESSQTDILGILLAGGEPIYYSDLYKLDINADLFLLLACLSGKGKVVTGEGAIGLNRALYAAGARNVLLYREILNNEANTLFCQKFYEEITGHASQNYGKSLQKARIAMMESDLYADPLYWAGYYLIGY
jgi:CHAT domain-containing protein